MNLQTFLQWFFIIASGSSIFGAWLAWASRKNGHETRKLMKELHSETTDLLKKLHNETTDLLKELHNETLLVLERMDRRAEERYRKINREIKKNKTKSNN